MEIFPTYAKLLLDGFAEQPENALLRTEMESGPPKQRKLKSRIMLKRPVTYTFDTKVEYQNFMTWYRTNINHGADWFTWTDPVDNTAKDARVVAETFQGGTPLNKALSIWNVKFDLETWE